MDCYLCKNREFDLISDKMRYECAKKVIKCRNCGLISLDSQMTPDEERNFYEKEYGEIFSKEKDTTPEKLFLARLPDAKMYLEWVKPFIDTKDTCLEIGCASGYFLECLRDNVKSVTGMEAHLLLHKYCEDLGIPMIQSLDECHESKFDRIFLFFLLEHLGDPVTFLSEIRRILRKGGSLFIVVPNADDALFSLYEIPEFRQFYFTPAHQFYYSKRTLTMLLEKCGFSFSRIIPKQRYDLSNHMHWMQYRRPGGFGKYNHIFSEKLRTEYAQNLIDHFLCDTLFAVVTK